MEKISNLCSANQVLFDLRELILPLKHVSSSIHMAIKTEFANKVIVKIMRIDICKVLIAVIILGIVLKLLLYYSVSKTENVGHNSLSQVLIIFINNLVHNHQDNYFYICMLH